MADMASVEASPAHAFERKGAIEIPRPALADRLRPWLIIAVLAGLLAWSFGPVEMSKTTLLVTDWRNMAEFLAGFAKPNFRDLDIYLKAMIETVQIAVWGTALAVVVGVPLAILASSNVAPQWVVQPVRRLMDTFRAINEIVFALMFVVAVGLGPPAGVLALAVHNIGIIAKLFSEAVEAIDPRPVEGIRAAGANRLQEVIYGVLPQVMPLWSSFTLYRLRDQRSFGDRSRHCRRRRHRPAALREHPFVPVFRDRRHHHRRGSDRHADRHDECAHPGRIDLN